MRIYRMMNKKTARAILAKTMIDFRSKTYRELCLLMGSPHNITVQGPDRTEYQIELEVFWDSPRKEVGDIRVIASIDDGGFLSSFRPLTADFIMSANGKFVGE